MRVLDWNESNQSWDLRPRVVVPTSQVSLPYGSYFSWGLSISNSGKLLVIGTHSKAQLQVVVNLYLTGMSLLKNLKRGVQ